MTGQSILVVDDEPDLRELAGYNLKLNGYAVLEAEKGKTGLDLVLNQRPSLVLLDIMLPDISGLDVCREIRRNPAFDAMPIIMLTAMGEDNDVVLGLELGANDYITKPFSPRVLLARIRAALRNTSNIIKSSKTIRQSDRETVSIYGISIEPDKHRAAIDGQVLNLSPSEFSILYLLLLKRGMLFSREQIIAAVKGDDYPVTNRSVDVHILNLRKKMGTKGNIIETVHGLGYKIRDLT